MARVVISALFGLVAPAMAEETVRASFDIPTPVLDGYGFGRRSTDRLTGCSRHSPLGALD
jgi:hypothetical protein